jgi:hypothetical protein
MITPDLIARADSLPITGDPTRDNWLARFVRIYRDTLSPENRAAFDGELIDKTAAMCSLGNECQRTLAPHGRIEDWFWQHEGGGVISGVTPDGPFSFTVPAHLADAFIALQGVFAAATQSAGVASVDWLSGSDSDSISSASLRQAAATSWA